MSRKARIGVIGTGWWATDTHIPSLRHHPDAELIAICDNDAQRVQAAAEKYAIERTYTDYQAMLSDEELDGVIVVTSNASHYTVTKGCLQQGLHVMLEKPMTLFASQAKELVELAQAQKRQLIIGYPFNYTPYALRAREVLQSGSLGAAQYINCIYNSYMTPLFTGKYQGQFAVHGPDQYTKPELTGGGHGQVQITHAAGLLFFVTGLRPRRVHASMANHGLPVDLVDAMTVEFADGALGSVAGTGNHRGLTFQLQIYCEEGWIAIDGRAGVATIHRDVDEGEETVPDERRETPLGYTTGHNLVDVILGKAENGSPAQVGWRAVELLDAAYRSAGRDGQPLDIEELYA